MATTGTSTNLLAAHLGANISDTAPMDYKTKVSDAAHSYHVVNAELAVAWALMNTPGNPAPLPQIDWYYWDSILQNIVAP